MTQDTLPIVGPLLVGYLMNWGLHGALCVQVYTYYIAFPNDKALIKFFIYGGFVVQCAETVVTTSGAFAKLATNFSKPCLVDNIHPAWLPAPILTGIIGFVGQLFFAHRIRILSRSWMLPSLIAFLAVLGNVAAIVFGVEISEDARFDSLRTQRSDLITSCIWFGASALCDMIIAIFMSYRLVHQDGIFRPRNQILLTRFICVTIETGILTAIVTVLRPILFFTLKNTTSYAAALHVGAKLYSNTMLVIFNNRMSIVGGRHDVDYKSSSHPMGTRLGSRWRRRKQSMDDRVVSGNVERVNVRTEVWIDSVSSDRLEIAHSKQTRELEGVPDENAKKLEL